MRPIKHILILFAVLSLSCEPKSTTIYMIGDSTMANKADPEQNPERGWGQMLGQFFSDKVTIDNRAVNGRSTRSFRTLGHWQEVYESLQPGDYVFIQFGHNDSKIKDSTRYTNPQTSYRHNLIRYVQEAREKQAIPILFSSIARRNFNEFGVLVGTLGDYPLETRLVAQEYQVPFIDLQYYSEELEKSYGPMKSKALHLHYSPGSHPYFPEGKEDNTHLSILGATEIAALAAGQIKKLDIDLARQVKIPEEKFY